MQTIKIERKNGTNRFEEIMEGTELNDEELEGVSGGGGDIVI